MDYEQRIELEVLKQIDKTREVSDEEVLALIDEVILNAQYDGYKSVADKIRLRSNVFNSMRGLDVLSPLLEDENVTEIMINGTDNIFIEKSGRIYKSELRFKSVDKLNNVIQTIVAGCNRVVNEASPIVDARLSDGSRVNVVLKPVALNGPVMTIRKFPKEVMTMEKLIDIGSLDSDIAEVLSLFVKSGYNTVISGGTGTGKTTFLNALASFIPKDERIITIEDSAELQIRGVDNLVSLEVRNANVDGSRPITMKDLIKSSLRMRPDRIIVGEVRGEEALDMLQALNTGHDGSISTAHANSAKDMLSRLETMVLMGVDMPMKALRAQIASAVEIIVHLGRMRDHSRRVVEIVEVLGMEDDEIMCRTLFKFQEDNYDNEKELLNDENACESMCANEGTHVAVLGQLYKWHELSQVSKLKQAGYYEEFKNIMNRIDTSDRVSVTPYYG